MDIQTRHRLKLLNAKCEYVCAVDNLSKKLDYGDDIECCLNKLFLAAKLINRLECYCFPDLITTTIENTIFKGQLVTGVNEYTEGSILSMYANGVLVSSQTVVSPDLSKQFNLYELISKSGYDFEYHQVTEDGSTDFDPNVIGYYIITMPCDVTRLTGYRQIGSEIGTLVDITSFFQNGVCEITNSDCYNCIEDSNLREMYAVLDQLLS